MDTGKLTDLVWHAERVLLQEKGLDSFIGWEKLPECPFKGRCYETTVAIYEMMDGNGLSLYRKKDIYGVWHWFMVIDELYEKRQNDGYGGEFVIDVTGRQYRHPVPSPTQTVRFGKKGKELEGCELMKKPLHYPSYKDKVERFKKSILDHMESSNKFNTHHPNYKESSKQPSRRVSIEDFVEQDAPQKPATDIEKPVTLDDFFT